MKINATILAIMIAQEAICQSQTPLAVAQVNASTPKFGITYAVRMTTERSQAEIEELLSQKKMQYSKLVADGKVTQIQADEILNAIRNMPTYEEESSTVSFCFEAGRLLVLRKAKTGVAWTLIDNGVAVAKGWSGGDHITLTDRSEPYSLANTWVPILPLQLAGRKVFTDLEDSGSAVIGRMITVSTTSDNYFPCTFQVGGGKIVGASVKGIERWKFENYRACGGKLPTRITMERLFDRDGQPRVRMECTQVPDVQLMVPLDRLITGSSVVVIDDRTDPPKQFTYNKEAGTILEQARAGVPILVDRKPYALRGGVQLSPGGILVGIGLLILFGVAIWQVAVKRKTA